MPGFVHLHVASGFSMRYGASHPETLAERAAERGMDAVALTDRDTLAGAVRFARASAGAGVRPVYGVDLAVAERPESRSAVRRRRTPVRGGAFIDESAQRVVFLAGQGAAGWERLCRLVTAAHASGGERPRLEWEDLAAVGGAPASGAGLHQDVLTVLLGPDSDVGRSLAAGRPDRAARQLDGWREIFGTQALRLEAGAHVPTRESARMLGLAAAEGIKPVLANGVRYADPGQGPVADVLDAARRLVPVDPRKGLDGGERWLKGPEAMAAAAERIAHAAGYRSDTANRLLTLTEETAGSCRVDPEYDIGIGRVHFPEPWLVGAGGGRSAERVLRSRCAAGMVARRYEEQRERWERLEHELRIIEGLGFSSYFLTVAQVVEDARAMGVRVAARGSGAGSLVNHLLGIAQADPLEHGLLMERFLSPRRATLPDIDIDVESARRLEVYRAVFDRFGEERVAAVAMPETYRVRHAIRDVGAALSIDPAETDRLAKSFPHIRARDARAALDELPELRGVDAEKYGPRFWDLVESLDALPRGIAMHPCGVLLSDSSLRARTPVVPTSGEVPLSPPGSGSAPIAMSQFDKDDVEELGLLKLDVLGVRMQSAMAHAVAEIERTGGGHVALDEVPEGDPQTYELIRSAETLGCFQIESPGQRDLVGRLQPENFHHLVVDISLFRPGPVVADMVRPFIEARHGRRPAVYPHPDLEPVLRETFGVVVFHEQIIEILSVMTGCGRAMADEARRALSDGERQGRVRAWFTQEASRRGYGAEAVGRTWEIVEAFGSYGFCKAHAVAFAVPTYQSAWLKAHHPAAFYAGVLEHDPGMYPKRLLLADARRRGVPVLPLDVNRSSVGYSIELVSDSKGVGDGAANAPEPSHGHSDLPDLPGLPEVPHLPDLPADLPELPGPPPERLRWGLRLALSDVQGISEADAERIAAGQPYDSLADLWRRARPPRPVAEGLARVGALDAFAPGGNRRDLLLQIAELHRQQRGRSGAREGQMALDHLAKGAAAPEPAGLPDLDADERLGAELGVLGMDTSRHLMDDHTAFLRELGAYSARALRDARHGETVLVAGAKAATQTPPIRSGRRVIFSTLDDGTGLVDLAFFDDSHAACAHTVFHSWLLLVRGVVQRRGPRSLSVVGSAAWDLAELAELRRTGGLDAVTARLAEPPGRPGPEQETGQTQESGQGQGQGEARSGGSGSGGRTVEVAKGYEMHPWADLRPPGDAAGSPNALRKLWHSSPGSAG
ncbi:DNA polymerase III subunit alpha [Streptomyces sp. WMMB 322]|uniref:DNA polymerase III subunit alpha n=1 Tax=Streptomyces sp. WMMB 322 TaxID=1286821 RepID=UPI0006E31961|nr:DNA polymerase III subunit alpha [Streptomyces sp. WMMB 322]SCK52820.1 DNA polymerase III, alpha subunit [Streptomyces sp. WMMB 322]